MHQKSFEKDVRKNRLSIILLTFLLLFLSPLLSSCVSSDVNNITSNMVVRIKKDYCNEYILPNDPDAYWDDVEFYQFLRRYTDKEYTGSNFYLIAWDVYEETEEWNLTIDNTTFSFSHEVRFLVYRFKTKTFFTIEEAYNEEFFSLENLSKGLERLDIFIPTE